MEELTTVPLVSDALEYHYGTQLPHTLMRWLNGEADLIVGANYPVEQGDVLVNEFGHEVIVMEIVERRKARGDWSLNPYDQAPDWMRVKVL